MKAKLHQTQNDLNEQTCYAMISLLNRQFADAIDLGLPKIRMETPMMATLERVKPLVSHPQ